MEDTARDEVESEDEKGFVYGENVAELLEKVVTNYEFRVKYYEELMRETVNEFERGLKRAHVDELSVLIEEASEETREMRKICQTIVQSLGRLIPVIYQSIEILEFQVKTDTEHLLSVDSNWNMLDATHDAEEPEKTQSEKEETKNQQTGKEDDENMKDKLGNVKLIKSINKIERQLIKGPIPPKVKVGLDKARKLGHTLIGFLEESKNVRSMFKDAQTEANSTAIVNFLAQASARTTEDSQNLALYYAKQSMEEVKEVEMQTSRQVTKLKTELLQRTKTSLMKNDQEEGPEVNTEENKREKESDAPPESKKAAENEEKKNNQMKEETKITQMNNKNAAQTKKNTKKEKPPGKGAKENPKKAKGKEKEVKGGKKAADEPKGLEAEKTAAAKEKTVEPLNEEERAEQERVEKVNLFIKSLEEPTDVHRKLSSQLVEYHVRCRQITDEVNSADQVFSKFPTKHRVDLECFVFHSIEQVSQHVTKVERAYKYTTVEVGRLLECLEDCEKEKEDIEQHEILREDLQSAHKSSQEEMEYLSQLMVELENVYNEFVTAKCTWEVEIPTGFIHDAKERIRAMKDLIYRVQFNRKELIKVSNILLKEVSLHEWSELVEIQLLGGPGREVDQVLAIIDKQTVVNESFANVVLAEIDRVARSHGLHKVTPLEEVHRAIPEIDARYFQMRSLLNTIQKLMVECKQNVNKLMDDPARKWSVVRLPRLTNRETSSGDSEIAKPIAVLRVPEECLPLMKTITVSMKHAWEKNAVRNNQVLVSEIVYFPNPPELPCNVLLGISHGVASLSEDKEILKIKQTYDGVDWVEAVAYKNHFFYTYSDSNSKNYLPSAMVFAELKTDELALAYCVVVEYTDGRNLRQAAPQTYTESKKIFKEGGKLSATLSKQSELVIPKDTFPFLASVSIKSITPGYVIESDLKRFFSGLSAVSPLYHVQVESSTVSQYTKFTLRLPYPRQNDDTRRPSTSRVSVLAFEKNLQEWVRLENSGGAENDVISISGGGACSVTFQPAQLEKIIVINGQCEHVNLIPDQLELMIGKLPRKPFKDDEVLDESLLRQIVDRLTLEFDRFAIVLGVSTQYRNKARVNHKTNASQQKFEILKEWRKKNADTGDLTVRILKSLRSEIVGRYDIADWLEDVIKNERQTYWYNRAKYQHTQQPTFRRDYVFSPATVATEEPILGGRGLAEPRTNSRGLSDVSFHDGSETEPTDYEGEEDREKSSVSLSVKKSNDEKQKSFTEIIEGNGRRSQSNSQRNNSSDRNKSSEQIFNSGSQRHTSESLKNNQSSIECNPIEKAHSKNKDQTSDSLGSEGELKKEQSADKVSQLNKERTADSLRSRSEFSKDQNSPEIVHSNQEKTSESLRSKEGPTKRQSVGELAQIKKEKTSDSTRSKNGTSQEQLFQKNNESKKEKTSDSLRTRNEFPKDQSAEEIIHSNKEKTSDSLRSEGKPTDKQPAKEFVQLKEEKSSNSLQSRNGATNKQSAEEVGHSNSEKTSDSLQRRDKLTNEQSTGEGSRPITNEKTSESFRKGRALPNDSSSEKLKDADDEQNQQSEDSQTNKPLEDTTDSRDYEKEPEVVTNEKLPEETIDSKHDKKMPRSSDEETEPLKSATDPDQEHLRENNFN